jgi:hypothetical protein
MPGSRQAEEFSDSQGVMRGPLFAADVVKVKELAKRDPALAFELTRAANMLQSYAQDRPYVFKNAKNKSVAESAVTLLRAAVASGAAGDAKAALALVNYFTGYAPGTQVTVVERDGIQVFAPGGDLNEVLRSNGGEIRVAKAVYNQLGTNLAWMADVEANVVVERPTGRAIPFEQGLRAFLRGSLSNPDEWLKEARQTYPLPSAENLTVMSPEVRNFIDELSRLTTSPYPTGPVAMKGALLAAETADDLINSGDRESAEQWLHYGRMMADMALGFVPVVGTALDFYSAVTGRNLITGEDLTLNERVVTAAGIVTFGVGDAAYKAWKGMKATSEVPRLLSKAIHGFEAVPTNELNQILRQTRNYEELAWRENARAYKFRLPERSEKQFVRVFSDETGKAGSWIVEKRLIEGKSRGQIKDTLRLKFMPTSMAEVHLPANTEVIRGPLNQAAFREEAEVASGMFKVGLPARVEQYFLPSYDKTFFNKVTELP